MDRVAPGTTDARSMSRMVDHEFAPVAESAKAARRLVNDALVSMEVERPDLLELFVSEVVTNAIIHARTAFRMTAEIDDGVVRVSIRDDDPSLPAVQAPHAAAVAGRGLKMISENATAWGVEPSATGKTVWFELPLP